MYSHIASAWRLKPAEQQRLRAAALARQRFAALAKLDGCLLALLLVVTAVNAANPGASSQGVQQPVGLLVGAAAALPLLGAWLAACWAAVLRRRRQLASAVDMLHPLSYAPPLLVIFTGLCMAGLEGLGAGGICRGACRGGWYMFVSDRCPNNPSTPKSCHAGATEGSQLVQPHGQVYLILYSLLFLAARTTTCWAARQLTAAAAQAAPLPGPCKQAQQVASSAVGGQEGSGEQPDELCLPQELLPLARGAWLRKLASSSGTLDTADSGTSSLVGCSFSLPGCGLGSRLGWRSGGGVPATLEGRQRFFQLSQDGACLRWSWRKWILMPHVESLECW